MQTEHFEDAPYAHPPDETDVNLRAYFDRFEDSRLDGVDLGWSDDELRQWDGNFRSDGVLMMVCCDRDVEIGEYRRVLKQFLEFRRSLRVDSAGRSPVQPVHERCTGKGEG